MEWRRLFEAEIVERGRRYFREGAVREYHEDGNYVAASVIGTHKYEVLIKLGKRGELKHMACDCPYADSGWNCKHMAAVMFEYDKRHITKKVDTDIKINIEEVKEEINYLRRRYMGRYGYVGYWKAVQFAAEVLEYLDREVDILIKQAKLEEAFNLANFIFEKMCSTPMDDDGEMMDTMDSVSLVWHEIYDEADSKIRKKMFDWMMGRMVKTKYEPLAQAVEDFVMAEFDEEDELRRKLEFCGKMIEKYESGGIEYGGKRWVFYKVRIMQQLNTPQEEIRNFYEEWSGEADMRISMADWLAENGELREAREILEKMAEKNDEHYYVDMCRKRLDAIYEKTGDIKAKKDNLKKLLSESVQDDRDLYNNLKKLYEKEEWSTIRRGVIAGMSRRFDKAYYYAKEKMDEELFNLLCDERSLEQMRKYADKLSNEHASDAVKLYGELLREEMLRCMNRLDYQRIVKHLKALCKIEGGRKTAMELVNGWRGEYKNRRALLEELEKFENDICLM